MFRAEMVYRQLAPDSQLRWHYLRTKSDVEAGVLGCSGISSSFSCTLSPYILLRRALLSSINVVIFDL
jgi:hypothetical protein